MRMYLALREEVHAKKGLPEPPRQSAATARCRSPPCASSLLPSLSFSSPIPSPSKTRNHTQQQGNLKTKINVPFLPLFEFDQMQHGKRRRALVHAVLATAADPPLLKRFQVLLIAYRFFPSYTIIPNLGTQQWDADVVLMQTAEAENEVKKQWQQKTQHHNYIVNPTSNKRDRFFLFKKFPVSLFFFSCKHTEYVSTYPQTDTIWCTNRCSAHSTTMRTSPHGSKPQCASGQKLTGTQALAASASLFFFAFGLHRAQNKRDVCWCRTSGDLKSPPSCGRCSSPRLHASLRSLLNG
uniref:Uncharacterized protein TCIL3000_11_2140 n=1 Tax=Trypanosoma congolense (strain IL3000) TaxID=1068625 RepID=G0UZK7_TRYCI|nr:unnamed protein product [Trypanosoma congolense IL3000]